MKPALLVLAAGMGSRYGGLKQMDQFGPSGETLMDYSIFDAARAGFEKVIFISRKDIVNEFKERVTSKYESKMQISFAMQELDMVPDGYKVPADRVKPWGTAHAVLVAKDIISEPIAVINADDFYGYESYKLLFEHLANPGNQDYCIIGYRADKTLSEHGLVSRAVLETDKSGYLQQITETKIRRAQHGLVSESFSGQEENLDENIYVSMNQMGFTANVCNYMETYFNNFLEKSGQDNSQESFLPMFVDEMMKRNLAQVRIIPTESKWFGVTYQEDKPGVKEQISKLIENDEYPGKIW